MEIRQDPITMLWCRSDGAVLMPPRGRRWRKFRWTFGSSNNYGYRVVHYKGKQYQVHRLVCRAFHGLPPPGKPETDHINRLRDDNRSCNLRWADRSLNNTNKDYVDQSVKRYGVRYCEDKKAYMKTYSTPYYAAYSTAKKAQGLSYRKGPDGKQHWLPRIRTTSQDKETE